MATNMCNFIIIIHVAFLGTTLVNAFDYHVSVLTESSVARTSDKFVSVTLDSGTIVNHWQAFDPTNPVAITLGAALSPAYFRVGGTTGDSLIYIGQGHHGRSAIPNSTFTAADWDKLNTFTRKSNLSLVFGLNSLYRQPGAAWDPSNAIELMKYSAQQGYVLDLELGNEPDIYLGQYGRSVDPTQLAADFGNLRQLMDSMPSFRYSVLAGPDTTSSGTSYSTRYLETFLKSGSQYIDALTFHHYYFEGRIALPEYFVDPARFDYLKYFLEKGQQLISNFSQGTETFWLGETSTAYGGGAPNLSSSFLAGFLWLDKLGLSAQYGAKVVMRQEFVGLNYGLVDYTDGVYTPNPDYWLTLLFKNLVGEVVLRPGGTDDKLRLYAHCTNIRSGYGPGSVTFYMMNLYNTTKTVSFSQFPDKELHIYVLSSGDVNTLITKSVQLNGSPLHLNNGQLPALPPVVQSSPTVSVPPFTMGFVVVPGARASSCL